MRFKPFAFFLTFPFFFYLILLYDLMSWCSEDLHLPFVHQISDHLSTHRMMLQQSFVSWFIGLSISPCLWGPLSDWKGRRPILLGSSFLFVASTFACAASTSAVFLIIARFFQGVSVGSVTATGYPAIYEACDAHQTIVLMMLITAIGLMIPAAAPLIGHMLLKQGFSWRMLWIGLAFIGLINVYGFWRWMPETNQKPLFLSFKEVTKNYITCFKNTLFVKLTVLFGLLHLVFNTWIAEGPFLMQKQDFISFEESPFFVFGGYFLATCASFIIQAKHFMKAMLIGAQLLLAASLFSLLLIWIPSNLLVRFAVLSLYTFGAGLLLAPLPRLTMESSEVPMGQRSAVFSLILGLCVEGPFLFLKSFFEPTWTLFLLGLFLLGSASYLLYITHKKELQNLFLKIL